MENASGPYREAATDGAVERAIVEIDRKLTAQLDEILHHPEFLKLESAWRGLKFLVDRIDFRENIRVAMLDWRKEDLALGLSAEDVMRTEFGDALESRGYGCGFGQKPSSLVVTSFEFGVEEEDVALLERLAAIAAAYGVPVLANAKASVFGVESFADVPNPWSLPEIFERPSHAKWNALRATEESRFLGLCVQRFLLRAPYREEPAERGAYAFEEAVRSDWCVWGPASFALATCVARAFAKYRWCPNVIGPVDGVVADLPQINGLPIEIHIGERQEYVLSELGFIALAYRRESGHALFYSASSLAAVPVPEDGPVHFEARLHRQLPYLFISTRIGFYLRPVQQEAIGRWHAPEETEKALQSWLSEYVADMDNPAPRVRSRRPFRKATVRLEMVQSSLKYTLTLVPHFRYMGQQFALTLTGSLDPNSRED